MSRLEDLQPNTVVRGILPDSLVTVVSVQWFGSEALELTYKTPAGKVANELLYRHDEPRIELVEQGRPWSFDGDGALFRLVSEAHRIRLAHLFDPVLAVHTSVVEPLPHQITAVYDSMLPRQPLRFLLADDPGAGKTIMAGLLMKELIARGDLQRCLVVCPGSLAEQWQDELYRRFHLPFEILTNDKLEAARTGNWFLETNLVIARLDKLSRNEDVQKKLEVPDCRWDLVVCDEAHKMSATHFGGEIKYTKRYKLGQLLSTLTRHFLLMTATPHNGKEEDFQLFMALLDGDRFEGRFRDGVHAADVSDLMRRMVKESLLTFDAKPLFPERFAYTVPYRLSDPEAQLYKEVTDYVREEFNRAEALQNEKRVGTVGFALTILQRRLASSPEAIYQSLRRRRERLESRLREVELLHRGAEVAQTLAETGPALDAEDVEDLEDAPDDEVEAAEEEILDQATAARTIAELKAEIGTLSRLESLALAVRRSGTDRKWRELASLLAEIFTPAAIANRVAEPAPSPYGAGEAPRPVPSPRQKLVIFTEHRDTLNYLSKNITTLLGRAEALVCIHGGMGREDRMKAQESFKHDPEVQVLLATDAAGEGINLQRAHLMVNYDLPWNPNRLEQRFGRIHRIGQTEVCHLWNLVAEETREGDVYRTLLEKLDEARKALGGQVFDVLGKLQFEGRPLRELLIEAIRYGEKPEVRARLTRVLTNAFDPSQLQDLLEERALAHDAMDASRVYRIREEMERAEARRLQPHYIESFFLEAFQRLGGTAKQREPRRYEVTHTPAPVRNRDRLIGIGEPVLPRYERIAFEKSLVAPQGQPLAAFVCPGHPLLDATIDLTLERHRDLPRRGTVLVDERDLGRAPRMLFYLEHAIQDASLTRSGERRVVSRRMLYVELDAAGSARHLHYAPYLDYRPLVADEPGLEALLARPECAWIGRELEQKAQAHAVTHVVPEHLAEVRSRKLDLLTKTEAAVKDRLTKEISYWDHRAEQLKLQEQAGKPNARLNSGEARKRADALHARLEKRTEEIKLERQIAPLPPVVLGGLLVVPAGLLAAMTGRPAATLAESPDTQAAAARARAVVMEIERRLGFEPTDRETEKLGYDIESRVAGTGKLRFIEVKGRVAGAATITVTRNEILYSLNKPDELHPGHHRVPRGRHPPRPLPEAPLPARAGFRRDERELRLRRAPDTCRGAELTTKLRVFVSSVQRELEDERLIVQNLLSTDRFLAAHCVPVLYELEPASPDKALEGCLESLDGCQVYLLVVGVQYGTPVGTLSITHAEYRRAKAKALPVLAFIKGDRRVKREEGTAALLAELDADGPKYKRFGNVIELQKEVRAALVKLLRDRFGIAPTSDENEIAEQTIEATSAFESRPLDRIRWRDLDQDVARHLIAAAEHREPHDLSEEELLAGAALRGLVWHDPDSGEYYATAAGIVLLAKDPSAVFPQCRILADAYRGAEPDGDPRDHEDVRGPMPRAIDRAIAFIDRNTRHPMRVVGLNRVRLDEYPVEALREALVNAVAHRQYEDAGRKIMLEVLSDRVIVSSPGLPPAPITLASLRRGRYRPCSRNPVLAQSLSYFHRIEERGSGFRRMREQMLDHGLEPPLLGTDTGYFQVTFPGPGDDIDRLRVPETLLLVTPAVEAQLNERQRRMMQWLAEGRQLTSRQCQAEFGITRPITVADFGKLVELGLAERLGAGRSTRYRLRDLGESSGNRQAHAPNRKPSDEGGEA